ncbi:MAG: hypothetical protein KatS3mg057_1662 [Herpetosiphonaceae bacterium]|nr:MAG: hypothetical protein KatS3mg057_1662 [Herpetosiphonaceae bacterium]
MSLTTSRPGLRGVRPPRPAPPSNDLLTLAGAVLRAPSGHAARPALRDLASRGRSPTGLRPSLIVLSALLAAPTHCTPEIVTALAATLKRTGDLAAAQTIAQQRARLGSQPQQETGALAAVIEACQRLALREITAGLTVALALRPPTRRWALPPVEAAAVAAAQRYVQRHVPGLLALLQTGHAVASLRDERLQLGPAAVTEARVRQRPQPTALTRRPRWLPEDEPQRPERPLPAPRPTSILPHLPIWQALGQPFPALQVQLLAAGRPAAQMRAVQFFSRSSQRHERADPDRAAAPMPPAARGGAAAGSVRGVSGAPARWRMAGARREHAAAPVDLHQRHSRTGAGASPALGPGGRPDLAAPASG